MRNDLPPPLPPEERRRLSAECVALRSDPEKRSQYEDARRRLAESHLRLVASLAGADEDLFADGVVIALEAIDLWDPDRGANVSTFLRLRLVQRLRPRRVRSTIDVEEAHVVDESESGVDPLDKLATAEDRERLAAAIDRLSDRQRFVLRRRFAEDWTLERVGAALGVSRERVRQIQAATIAELREMLDAP